MAKTPSAPKVNTCLACKQPESPQRMGSRFDAKGQNGMLIQLWLCNKCAIPLGPSQGPIDMDDPTLKV